MHELHFIFMGYCTSFLCFIQKFYPRGIQKFSLIVIKATSCEVTSDFPSLPSLKGELWKQQLPLPLAAPIPWRPKLVFTKRQKLNKSMLILASCVVL